MNRDQAGSPYNPGLGACRRIRSLGPCARRKSNARKGLGYLFDKLLEPDADHD